MHFIHGTCTLCYKARERLSKLPEKLLLLYSTAHMKLRLLKTQLEFKANIMSYQSMCAEIELSCLTSGLTGLNTHAGLLHLCVVLYIGNCTLFTHIIDYFFLASFLLQWSSFVAWNPKRDRLCMFCHIITASYACHHCMFVISSLQVMSCHHCILCHIITVSCAISSLYVLSYHHCKLCHVITVCLSYHYCKLCPVITVCYVISSLYVVSYHRCMLCHNITVCCVILSM